jgi:hypothetical protein
MTGKGAYDTLCIDPANGMSCGNKDDALKNRQTGREIKARLKARTVNRSGVPVNASPYTHPPVRGDSADGLVTAIRDIEIPKLINRNTMGCGKTSGSTRAIDMAWFTRDTCNGRDHTGISNSSNDVIASVSHVQISGVVECECSWQSKSRVSPRTVDRMRHRFRHLNRATFFRMSRGCRGSQPKSDEDDRKNELNTLST